MEGRGWGEGKLSCSRGRKKEGFDFFCKITKLSLVFQFGREFIVLGISSRQKSSEHLLTFGNEIQFN